MLIGNIATSQELWYALEQADDLQDPINLWGVAFPTPENIYKEFGSVIFHYEDVGDWLSAEDQMYFINNWIVC